MTAYFVRRLLLVPLTFLVITFMVYAVLRVVPGGPIEQVEAALRMAAMEGEGGAGGAGGGPGGETDLQLDEEGMRELERYYALDRPIPVGYLQWLGLWPRPLRTRVPASTLEREAEAFRPLRELAEAQADRRAELEEVLSPLGWIAHGGAFHRPLAEGEAVEADLRPRAEALAAAGFGKRDELLALLGEYGYTWRGGTWFRRVGDPERAAHPEEVVRAEALLAALDLAARLQDRIRDRYGYEVDGEGRVDRVARRFSGILQGDFGRSYTHGERVLGLIASKMEVSVQFGLVGYFMSWVVCVPLGVFKAIRHRSLFDAASSFVVFLGYAMPGFVVCMLLLVWLAGGLGWLPLGGYKPEDIELMGFWEALAGRARHMLIPMTGYMVGSFATMTILMKNSLMENLSADYVRTAFAKGLPERRVIFVHALRNSLIPITAGIGHAIGILFAGSFLIEKTCNIDGMGLLGFEAVLQRDYPIILGTLVLGVLIQLFGNILSDLIWAAIDPRIRFGAAS
ncbi:MAG: ABC transporter permease subunit [Planctomycetes bacterium]|nr:ABC transporter permease subunit [Planctomycetota bacterium]